MASYAAVKSLQQTISHLANFSTISILPSSLEILQFSFDEARPLQEEYLDRLESSSGKKVNIMRAQIREVASELEDAVLSHIHDQFLSQTEDQINIGADKIISVHLEEVQQELCSFAETAKRIMKENRIGDLLAEEEDDDDDISLTTDFGGKCSKMVGFSDIFSKTKDAIKYRQQRRLNFVSLVGMAGIGKATLAMKVFEDPEILSHFDNRVLVTIGPKYKKMKDMPGILAQLTLDIDEIHNKVVDEVKEYLFKTLGNRRYLIALDDVWDTSIHYLIKYLPCHSYSHCVLVTTCINEVTSYCIEATVHQMPFLNKEESWDLLREGVFGEQRLCTFELEKYGKKIAENCEDLSLAIVVVAGILSKNEKTLEYWKQTTEKKIQFSEMHMIKCSPYSF